MQFVRHWPLASQVRFIPQSDGALQVVLVIGTQP
jgi:hypothetical protein